MPLTNSILSGVESWMGVLFRLTLTASLSVCSEDSTCSGLKPDLRHWFLCDPVNFAWDSLVIHIHESCGYHFLLSQLINLRELPLEPSCPIRH